MRLLTEQLFTGVSKRAWDMQKNIGKDKALVRSFLLTFPICAHYIFSRVFDMKYVGNGNYIPKKDVGSNAIHTDLLDYFVDNYGIMTIVGEMAIAGYEFQMKRSGLGYNTYLVDKNKRSIDYFFFESESTNPAFFAGCIMTAIAFERGITSVVAHIDYGEVYECIMSSDPKEKSKLAKREVFVRFFNNDVSREDEADAVSENAIGSYLYDNYKHRVLDYLNSRSVVDVYLAEISMASDK